MLRLLSIYGQEERVFEVPEYEAQLGSGPENDLVLRVPGISRRHALVRRERALLAFDADLGSETSLVSNVEPFAGLVVNGPLAAVGTTLFDAAAARIVGTLPGRPLLLTPSGDALVAEGGTASADAFARGPLRWHRAAAPE